jgi:NADP-dependent 3-hydroxy acid dehydrogenase YdfG
MTEQLLERGDRVAGTARKMNAMNDLKAKYGDLLWLAHLDVTDTPPIHELVNKAFAGLGKIDVVVDNTGYGLFGAAEELTNEQIAHQIDTNLISSIQVVRELFLARTYITPFTTIGLKEYGLLSPFG